MNHPLKIIIAIAFALSSCRKTPPAPIPSSPVDDAQAIRIESADGDSTDYRLRHHITLGDYSLRIETTMRCDSNYIYVPKRNQLRHVGKEDPYFQRCDEYGAIQCFGFFHHDTLVGTMDNRTILNEISQHYPGCCDIHNAVVDRVMVLRGTKGVLYKLEAVVAGDFELSALVDLNGTIQRYNYPSKVNPWEEGDPMRVSEMFGINPPDTEYSWDLSGPVVFDLYM